MRLILHSDLPYYDSITRAALLTWTILVYILLYDVRFSSKRPVGTHEMTVAFTLYPWTVVSTKETGSAPYVVHA